jgi:apolipoprotein D and lipocalin family protein
VLVTRRILTRGLVALALVAGSFALAAPAQAADPTPVPAVDAQRYVGAWYQVAAVPAIFEIQCAKNVTATYALNADGTIAVKNQCRTWFGGTSTVNGNARVDNAPASSALTVSFFKLGGRWQYLGGSNYLILGVGAQYDWAVVGDPDRSSGFVLSRTPALSAAQLTAVRGVLTANGYDPCDLKVTKQDGGSATRGPLC